MKTALDSLGGGDGTQAADRPRVMPLAAVVPGRLTAGDLSLKRSQFDVLNRPRVDGPRDEPGHVDELAAAEHAVTRIEPEPVKAVRLLLEFS